MLMTSSAKDKLFRKLKSGDTVAFHDLLEGERQELYDYLMRMTGQISRSADTVDEVYQSLSADIIDSLGSFPALKLCLFTTARKFNADIWNADTSRLLNAAIEGPLAAEDVTEKATRERNFHKALDRCLRILPGREREALVLRARSRFEDAEIAEIMGVGEAEARAYVKAGLAKVRDESLGQISDIETALHRLPAHPAPVRSTQATINLSDVMQGIKAKPTGLSSPARIALLVLLLALGASMYLHPSLFRKIWSVFRGTAGGG